MSMVKRSLVQWRTWVAVAAMVGAGARAQTLELTFDENTDLEEITVGPNDCDGTRSLTWRVPINYVSCQNLKVWTTRASTCPSAGPADGDAVLVDVAPTSGQSATVQLDIDSLPIFGSGLGQVVCGSAGFNATARVCALWKASLAACNGSQDFTNSLEVTYDTLPPGVPTVKSVTALDGALKVEATVDSDTVQVVVRTTLAGVSKDKTVTAVSSEVATSVDGLTNGETYDVQVSAVDAAGNASAFSSALQGTPEATYGFWWNYRQEGGKPAQGCASAAGGALVVLALLWRRRKS